MFNPRQDPSRIVPSKRSTHRFKCSKCKQKVTLLLSDSSARPENWQSDTDCGCKAKR